MNLWADDQFPFQTLHTGGPTASHRAQGAKPATAYLGAVVVIVGPVVIVLAVVVVVVDVVVVVVVVVVVGVVVVEMVVARGKVVVSWSTPSTQVP